MRGERIVFWAGFLLATFGVGCVVFLLPASGIPAYTADSIHYILASRAIASGHGISLFNYALFAPHFVPYTTWPPLYPLLLATQIPPLLIQAGLLASLATFSYLLLVRLAHVNCLVALPMTLVVVLSWPLLIDASYVWSELFALFWVFLAMVLLAPLGDSKSMNGMRVTRYWLLAVVALSLAVYTRYAALVFLPGLMLILLRAPVAWPRRWVMVLATPVVAGILISPLLLRGLIASGALSGGVRAASKLGAGDLFSSAGLYIGWVFAVERMTREVFVASLLALILAVAIYLKDRRHVLAETGESDRGEQWLAWMATSFSLAYVIGIVAFRSWKSFDWGVRIVSPMVPLMLIALSAWSVVIWRGTRVGWQRAVLVMPFVALLSLSALTSWQMGSQAWHTWRTTGSPRWHKSTLTIYLDLRPVEVPKLQGIVLDSRPAELAFRTGWDVRYMPKAPWSHAKLVRIAGVAAAVLIDNRESVRLMRALQPIVPNGRLVRIKGVPVFLWGGSQPALGG